MASKTWVGGGDNLASAPADWSPNGAPAAGDTLSAPNSATINISGADLKGNPLSVGTAQAAVTDLIGLTNQASLTLRPVAYSTVNATVNVFGANSLTVDGASGFPNTEKITVNLPGRAQVTGTFKQVLAGSITYNGGGYYARVVNNGASTLQGSRAVINPDVVGIGSFSVTDAQSFRGYLEFGAGVASTQSVKLSGDQERGPVTLKIDKVSAYHAPIDFDKAVVDIANLQASSFSYNGSTLSLYGAGGSPVASLALANHSTIGGVTQPIVVSQGATDVFVSAKGFGTPSGTTLLPRVSAVA